MRRGHSSKRPGRAALRTRRQSAYLRWKKDFSWYLEKRSAMMKDTDKYNEKQIEAINAKIVRLNTQLQNLESKLGPNVPS